MKDRYGRTIDYLRLSITDRCNLRCRYCMPAGCQWLPMGEILTLEEFVTLSQTAAQLGIRKLKVTGGEPLVRRGCLELVAALKQLSGIEQVTLTTNAVELERFAPGLRDAGLDGVNVSLDTLDPERFQQITGFDLLPQVLRGLETALNLGLKVKINAVLQRGVNEDAWPGLLELARNRPLDVRFIEMMPIGLGKGCPSISNVDLRARMEAKYGPLRPDDSVHGNGPAVYWRLDGFTGSVGFISAIHSKFCSTCNRVRLTSTGFLKGCLCYNDGEDLREPLRRGDLEEVRRRFRRVLENKPDAHCFEQLSQVTELREMSKIGG